MFTVHALEGVSGKYVKYCPHALQQSVLGLWWGIVESTGHESGSEPAFEVRRYLSSSLALPPGQRQLAKPTVRSLEPPCFPTRLNRKSPEIWAQINFSFFPSFVAGMRNVMRRLIPPFHIHENPGKQPCHTLCLRVIYKEPEAGSMSSWNRAESHAWAAAQPGSSHSVLQSV